MTSNPDSHTPLRGRWLVMARAAWVVVAVLAMAVFVLSIPGHVLGFGRGGPLAPAPPFWWSLVNVLLPTTATLVSLFLAAVLFRRRSKDRMALFVSFYLLVYGVVHTGPLDALEPLWTGSSSFAGMAQALFFSTPTVALIVLFPNGRFAPGWTRRLVVASTLVIPLRLYLPAPWSRAVSHPFFWVFGLPELALVSAALYAQIYRYRHLSTPTERQQTKWVMWGLLIWFVLMVLAFVPWFVASNLPPGAARPWWLLFFGVGWSISMTVLPISLAVAILRYRLWDIDVIIRRTLIYGVLSAALALVYFGSVVLLRGPLLAVTGQQDSPFVTVISTLAIAALFAPLRRRVQDVIDRRLYRRKYDAAKVLAEFGATVRDETDLDRLAARLVEVVQETMQPAHVSLWLRPTADGRPETAKTASGGRRSAAGGHS